MLLLQQLLLLRRLLLHHELLCLLPLVHHDLLCLLLRRLLLLHELLGLLGQHLCGCCLRLLRLQGCLLCLPVLHYQCMSHCGGCLRGSRGLNSRCCCL